MIRNISGMKIRLSMVAFMLVLFPACASISRDRVGAHIAVERMPSADARISKVYLRRDGKGLAISGELRPPGMKRSILPGHMLIEIIGPDGKMIKQAKSHYYRVGKINKKMQKYTFSVILPKVPPAGSTIRLRYEGTP